MIRTLQKQIKDFIIKYIKEEDFSDLYNLEKNNIQYFQYTKEEPNYNSIIEEVYELPNNITIDKKHFIGFYNHNKLIAVMDLIDGYPDKQTYWIGLFIIDIEYQHIGIGTYIMNNLIEYSKKNIQLGCLSNNQEGFAFWSKLGFREIRRAYNKEKDWDIIVMEKMILNS